MDRNRSVLPVLDVVVAVALVAAAVLTEASSAVAHPWAELVGAAWMGVLVLRTRAPFVMALGASVGAIAWALLPEPETPLWSFAALLIVGFCNGASLTGRRRWIAVASLLVSTYVLQVAAAAVPGATPGFADTYLSPPLLVGAPLLAGVLLRRSRHQTAELRRLSAELAAERETHARDAAAAERNRIARELHDVIAHSVTVMVVQAGAAEQQLPPGSAAREQLQTVRRTGKDALTELRRQLGVLREGPDLTPSPVPGLSEVSRLAAVCGASLHYDPVAVGEVPPGLSLAAYRVVQESLTNARRHAEGAGVGVRVERAADCLSLEVVNGPGQEPVSVSGSGHGLPGMRERADLYGGWLEAGPTPEGGWRVSARLPIPPAGSCS